MENSFVSTWKKHKPFAKFLEWRSNNTSLAYDTLPSNPDICQVPTDDAVRLNNGLEQQEVVDMKQYLLSYSLWNLTGLATGDKPEECWVTISWLVCQF